MELFDALAPSPGNRLGHRLCGLPDVLRERARQALLPMPWDTPSAGQRCSVALQRNCQHSPATAQGQKYWQASFAQMGDLKKQVAEWEAVATPMAADLAAMEA